MKGRTDRRSKYTRTAIKDGMLALLQKDYLSEIRSYRIIFSADLSAREKHMLPYLQKQGLSEAEAPAFFLFFVSGAFAVNRDYDWQKDGVWLRVQQILMTFLDGGYNALRHM